LLDFDKVLNIYVYVYIYSSIMKKIIKELKKKVREGGTGEIGGTVS